MLNMRCILKWNHVCVVVIIKVSTLIKSCTALTANPNTNEGNLLHSMFHRASKPTNLWVLSGTLFCIHIPCIWLDPWILFHFLCDLLHRYRSLAATLRVKLLPGVHWQSLQIPLADSLLTQPRETSRNSASKQILICCSLKHFFRY